MRNLSIRVRLWILPFVVATGLAAVLAVGYSTNRSVEAVVAESTALRADRDAITDAWFGVQQVRTSLLEAWSLKEPGEIADRLGIVSANLDFIGDTVVGPLRRAGRDQDFQTAFRVFRTFVEGRMDEMQRGESPSLDRIVDDLRGPSEAVNSIFLEQYQGVIQRLEASDMAIRDANRRQNELSALVAGIVLAVLMVAMTLTIRSVVGPLAAIEAAMLKLAGGDYVNDIPHADGRGEIGSMARAVKSFKESLLLVEQLKEEQRQGREQTERLERRRGMDEAFARFDRRGQRMLANVQAALNEVNSAAEELTNTASDTARRCEIVAGGAGAASVNVNSVAQEIEGLAGQIGVTLNKISDAARVAAQGSCQVRSTDDAVRSLSEAASRIGEVVGLIVDIAGRTRMLALNASIEAARAGEAGKGFAVVAGEVKHLADQTTRATEEIIAQIGAVQSETERAVETIQLVNNIILDIDGIVRGVATIAEEQGQAALRIKDSVRAAARGSGEASRNIAAVADAANATDELACRVFEAAATLSQENADLREAIEDFLKMSKIIA